MRYIFGGWADLDRANQGSEYITEIADSNRAAVRYVNGAAVPAGTQLTVVVATGRPCD